MNQHLTELYNFNLPKELIAQQPRTERDTSKLLVYNREKDKVEHLLFKNIVEILDDTYCIILNNTKVEQRKINLKKPTGGIIPVLITHYDNNILKCLLYKRLGKTNKLFLPTGVEVRVESHDTQTQEVILEGNFTKEQIEDIFNQYGLAPLPPYIKRKPDDNFHQLDKQYYQTIYATKLGSIAAPTAGLHFTEEILTLLSKKGVEILYITLHIGISTFKPVKTKSLFEHKLLPEHAEVKQDVAEKVNSLLSLGKKLLCVGTTTVRTLEFLATKYNKIVEYNGPVDLFIYPGYKFKVTSCMLTNFHLPKSTNLVLVSAFVGREKLLELYNIAIEKKYKFYSYGDAMLII